MVRATCSRSFWGCWTGLGEGEEHPGSCSRRFWDCWEAQQAVLLAQPCVQALLFHFNLKTREDWVPADKP